MIPAGKYLSKVSNEINRKLIVDMVSASRWKSGFCLLLKSYRGIGIALGNRHFYGQGFPWNDHRWAVNEIGKAIFTKLYLCLWISELVRDKCVRACVRACVCVCMRACVRACVCVSHKLWGALGKVWIVKSVWHLAHV